MMMHLFILTLGLGIATAAQIPAAISAERATGSEMSLEGTRYPESPDATGEAQPPDGRRALFAQLQPPTTTTPSISGTPKLPIAPPHAGETDRDMIIKILDSIPGILEQLKLLKVDTTQVKNDTAQIQLKLDSVAAQVRRPVGWSLQVPPNERWELLLNNQVVLDRETGLVWERAASQQPVAYAFAIDTCRQKKVLLDRNDYVGKLGWRVPSTSELQSLLPLAPGHPFQLPPEVVNLGIGAWSLDIVSPGHALAVQLTTGRAIDLDTGRNSAPMWCVRGND